MERITYQRTLDVHKNGIQFTLQGVETGDNLSRVVEISLMASGDAIEFPLENLLPLMYVKTPNATEPSIIECTIKDNTVIYEILPIVEEGITEMQLKLIETTTAGAKKVLVAPKFAVEVTKSNADDSSAIQKTEFTALETAAAKAKSVYDKRFLRMELTSDCIFKAYYADGTLYETDILKQLFHTGDAILAQSYARGGTGVRSNEDTDNAMYYSNVSKSASLEAKDAIKNSEEMLAESRLHGVYTAFNVNFENGEVEYVSPSYSFNLNLENGELEVIGKSYSFEDDIGRLVIEWMGANGVDIKTLQDISKEHTEEIRSLQISLNVQSQKYNELLSEMDGIKNDISNLKIDKAAIQNDVGLLYDRTSQLITTTMWRLLGKVTDEGDEPVSSTVTTNVTIPIDETLLKECSQLKLVIKKDTRAKAFLSGNSLTAEDMAELAINICGKKDIGARLIDKSGSGNYESENKLESDLTYNLFLEDPTVVNKVIKIVRNGFKRNGSDANRRVSWFVEVELYGRV